MNKMKYQYRGFFLTKNKQKRNSGTEKYSNQNEKAIRGIQR